MPLLSVLSTVYAPSAPHLTETIASMAAQTLPDGWELEWVVQEDGEEPRSLDHFAGLPHVRYDANRQRLGPAVTRNLGISRVRGDLVRVLDHDDVLLPHALATLIPVFADPSIHWAVGQADDLLPDGTRMEYPSALPFGRVPAGAANDWAIAHDGNWPIHCAGLMMRTATLRAIGGYAGTPLDDDVSMFAALSEIVDGFNDETLTWLYRIHPAQLHKSAAWRSHGDAGRRIALQRIVALRRMPLRLDHSAASKSIPHRIRVGPLVPEKRRHARDPLL